MLKNPKWITKQNELINLFIYNKFNQITVRYYTILYYILISPYNKSNSLKLFGYFCYNKEPERNKWFNNFSIINKIIEKVN